MSKMFKKLASIRKKSGQDNLLNRVGNLEKMRVVVRKEETRQESKK